MRRALSSIVGLITRTKSTRSMRSNRIRDIHDYDEEERDEYHMENVKIATTFMSKFCNFSDMVYIPTTHININKACIYYHLLFLNPEIKLYYYDLYIIYLLLLRVYINKSNKGKQTKLENIINIDNLQTKIRKAIKENDIGQIEEEAKNLLQIYLNDFVHDTVERTYIIKNLNTEELINHPDYTLEDFKNSFSDDDTYNEVDIMFCLSLLVRKEINILFYKGREKELLNIVLGLFNSGHNIDNKTINFALRPIVRPIDHRTVRTVGGKIKKPLYKLISKKVKLLYKNKKIVRSVYLKIKNNKEYCKINKKYILLSKLVRI